MQVFFESSQTLDMDSLHDAIAHMGATSLNSFHRNAVLKGYLPGSIRYRRNYKALRVNWQKLAREAYERPMSDSDGAFWACLRRAYPNALNDEREWEQVLANTGLMYGAGSETTANAIAMTLTALALDRETLRSLEEVRISRAAQCVGNTLLDMLLEAVYATLCGVAYTASSSRSSSACHIVWCGMQVCGCFICIVRSCAAPAE